IRDNPRPLPLPISLVVKKGSNTRSRTSFGIPAPVSSTEISIHGPGDEAPCSDTRPGSHSIYASAIVSVPPFAIASRALTARFNNAASSSDGSISQISDRSDCQLQSDTLANGPLNQRFELTDQRVHVERLWFEVLSSRKYQQLLR